MATYYQYGWVDPSRPRTEVQEQRLNEPTLYCYMPPQQQAQQQVVIHHQPPAPPAPPAPPVHLPPPPPPPPPQPPAQPPAPPAGQGLVTIANASTQATYGGIQVGMTQQIYTGAPTQGGPAIQTQYASPAPPQPTAVPAGAVPWQGPTVHQVNARNASIAAATGRPHALVPYKPAEGQQWWCRELDNSWTLRTTFDIQENLQPGTWHQSVSGWPYFIRQAPNGT